MLKCQTFSGLGYIAASTWPRYLALSAGSSANFLGRNLLPEAWSSEYQHQGQRFDSILRKHFLKRQFLA